MKREILPILIVSFVFVNIMLLSLVSAGIIIKQPQAVYNLGDDFSTNVEVDAFQEGYLDVNLVCNDIIAKSTNLYHGILTANIIQIDRKLIPSYIQDLKGQCFIQANYGIDTKTSQVFEISNEIDIELELNDLSYKAGEEIVVKGRAFKKNKEIAGLNTNAYIDIKIGEETKTSGSLSGGQFEVKFLTNEKMPAGNHVLIVEVYEQDSNGNKSNQGETRADLLISQEPSWIEIAIDKQTVIPEEEITIIPFLYDKSNTEINSEEVLLKITDSKGKLILEKIILTGEEMKINLRSDHVVGHTSLVVEKGNLFAEKILDVREYPKIKTEISNKTLFITNIGNVKYDKPVEVNIGEQTVILNVYLDIGKTAKYSLSAPDGDYDLTIKDDSGLLHQGGALLTGNVIAIKETGANISNLLLRYPLIWIFVIVIIVLAIIILYKKIVKRDHISFPVEKFRKEHKEEAPINTLEDSKDALKFKNQETGFVKGDILKLGENKNIVKPGVVYQAEHVLVLNGQKQEAGIVLVKIKNDLDKIAKKTVHDAIKKAYSLKGAACQKGDEIIIVFSPIITKTMQNSRDAVKIGSEIDKALHEHNNKYRNKIEYGIGITSGEIIAKIEKGVLKFTSIGQTINLAKKIAKIADKKVLISQDAHNKTRSVVKVEKAETESKENKIDLFAVKRVVDQERNTKFIQDFMRRV